MEPADRSDTIEREKLVLAFMKLALTGCTPVADEVPGVVKDALRLAVAAADAFLKWRAR